MKNYYVILGVSIVLAAGTGIFLYKQHAKWVKNNEAKRDMPHPDKPKPPVDIANKPAPVNQPNPNPGT